MIITTTYGDSEIKIQTITTASLASEPYRVYLVHCFRCGNPLSQIQGRISRIFPGFVPDGNVTVIQKCRQCGELYTFQTAPKRKSLQPVRVVLSTQKINNDFICPICVTPLLQFTTKGIVTLPEFIKQAIPFIISCTRIGCPGKFRIVDLI